MNDALVFLIASITTDAEKLRAAAKSDLAYGLQAAKILEARAVECDRIANLTRNLVHGEPTVAPAYGGPGPHAGPCEACGGISNSYSRLCRLCDEVDADHYFISAEGVPVKNYATKAEKKARQREHAAAV